ncbi:MAG: mechanosensitive ion channel family protein [Alphaproteobacteria bacterium]
MQDLNTTLDFLKTLEIWFFDNVLVWGNLVQICLLLSIFMTTYFTYERSLEKIKSYFRKQKSRWINKDIKNIIVDTFYPGINLVILWMIITISKSVGIKSYDLFTTVSSLLTAWILIRFTSVIVRNQALARLVSFTAWTVAALVILHLFDPVAHQLNAFSFSVGNVRISLLGILKGALSLTIIIWLAYNITRIFEKRVNAVTEIDPSLKVLSVKLFKIMLGIITFLLFLNIAGIDMTAFAVFTGAVGVGIGLGLQKVFSNILSGVLLLLEKSLKPGDVISVGERFGWVNSLTSRYVSIITREGKEHLIPNEDIITREVVNWSHSSKKIRLSVPFGVAYNSDPHEVIALVKAAVGATDRVLDDPKPNCIIREFGESAIKMEARFWIKDPSNGVNNLKGNIYLAIWDTLKENGIEIPLAQRVIRFRDDATSKRMIKEMIEEVVTKKKKTPSKK